MNLKKLNRLVSRGVLKRRPDVEAPEHEGHVGKVERTAIRQKGVEYVRPTCHCGWADAATTSKRYAQAVVDAHLKEQDRLPGPTKARHPGAAV